MEVNNKRKNQELLNAITAIAIDYEHINKLLSEGANPIGPLEEDEDGSALEELFCEASDSYPDEHYKDGQSILKRMPRLIEMFVQHGMNPAEIKQKDGDHNLALWCMTFCISDEAIASFKILLDNGLNAGPVEDLIDHFLLDFDLSHPVHLDEEYKRYIECGLKMMMLAASYPNIMKNSKYMPNWIELDETNKGREVNLEEFRNYNQFDYYIEAATADNSIHNRDFIVYICRKDSDEPVWILHI